MRKFIQKPAQYLFGVLPLAAVVLLVNFKRQNDDLISKSSFSTTPKNAKPEKETANMLFGQLPCGFKSQALQSPEKPTFVTNDAIPVLQYPAGSYPGTANQISNVLYSEGQNDQLILQPDGNVVIYCVTCNPAKALWSTQTKGKGGQALFFQTNGDLVLKNALGKILWHSNIVSKCTGSDQAYFTLQDDGNLAMLYNETVSKPGSTQATTVTDYLGGTTSTNDETAIPHPGKIQ